MLVYVNTNEGNIARKNIVEDIAPLMGINYAENLVSKWYDNYDAFAYDKETSKLLFYKSRVLGQWSSVDENLQDFKIDIK